MRKLLLPAFASCSLLVLAAPAGALAHSHAHRRGARHSARRHHRHAVIQLRDFKASGAPPLPAGAAEPAGPQQPAPPVPEKAATVVSYAAGVLTIRLNDNSTVSGKVGEETDIRCVTAAAPEGGEDEGQESSMRAHDSSVGGDEQSQEGDDQDQQQGDGEHGCTGTPLSEGATVLDAELAVGPGGAVWRHVEILQ